ncbi:putative phage tail assembly chaperone [Marinibactrum halimedae]|uniref:Phage tail assembly protein n=1 Tax=Marinibactrum halimedae TaxID=1444977 RepID=A0AA37TBR7_9GAMM|nr:putative phage tail assembly chaperone [Marinibactrum halimedae]MCD9458460.1 putative phage tail assembly chaperone [Marinibactrum halimedae]GLS26157.1 hypothetical protein GCM10007877_18720 [Marinibactrum halimedae]
MSKAVNHSDGQTVAFELGDGQELNFSVTRDAYSKFIDEAGVPEGRVVAMHTLLMRCADEKTKDILRPLLKHAPNINYLCGQLMKQYTPDISVTVK